MHTIYDLITFDLEKEHELEHNPEHEKPYSEPKIYDANGDLSKRWYLYFSFKNPETGKMERSKNIYGKTNRHKTKTERYSILNIYKKRLSKLLSEGYSPYEDNQKRFENSHKNKTKIVNDIQKQQPNGSNTSEFPQNINQLNSSISERMKISEAFDFVLKLKVNQIGASTLADYRSRCNKFLKWIKDHKIKVKFIHELEKKHLNTFLNNTLQETSARNRNNYRACLGSIFQTLEDNDIIKSNFIKQIKPLPTKPKRNKTYSAKEQKEIFEYLELNDKTLLLFIQFISYNLLRPIEVCRLRVKDINLEQNIIQFQAKNKTLKTKIIPELLVSELPDLSKYDSDALLFTPNGLGQNWEATEINRRDYFTKRFKKVIKDHFGLNDNYGLYSFRHTFITKLYKAISKNSSPNAAKSKLMQITGHGSMSALEKYLRDIDAELPEDYSEML